MGAPLRRTMTGLCAAESATTASWVERDSGAGQNGGVSAKRRSAPTSPSAKVSSERDLVALSRVSKSPVATSLNGKASIRDDRPLAVGVVGTYARRCANEVLASADVVFFADSPVGGMTTNKWTIARSGTTVIQLDLDPVELSRSYPLTVALMGDARATFQPMLTAAGPCRDSPWVADVQENSSAGQAKDMWTFGDVDLAHITLDFGCSGIRVRSPYEFRSAIQNALVTGQS